MNDYPPPPPRPPPPTVARAFEGLLESLYLNLRTRPMGAARQIAGPAGPIEEELELSYPCRAEDLEAFTRALDRAIRGDAALWAGYDGSTSLEDGSVVFFWPRWISLRVFPKR